MDQVIRSFRELQLKVAFLEKRGTAFQDFFSDIMELVHPGDFQRVCPWGNVGDRKCDGFRSSDRTLFAIYAPEPGEKVKLSKWVNKIDSDFTGALPYWQNHFEQWTFVHNREQGLPPDVLSKLEQLQKDHPDLKIVRMGPTELRKAALNLGETELLGLLGPAVSSSDFAAVGFDQIRVVVEAVASQPAPCPSEIRPVPSHKIEANALSNGVAILLKAGMEKADVVARFFSRWHDATLGDRVAQAFRAKYEQLRRDGLSPNDVFAELWKFAGGHGKGNADNEAAVLAVIASLFESCDIFEEPQGGAA